MEKGSKVLSSRQYSDSGECHHATEPEGAHTGPAAALTRSSSRLKPLPARTFVWYLTVGHLTMGLMGPDAGRGAMRRAFACRALRLQEEHSGQLRPARAHAAPEPTRATRTCGSCVPAG